MPFGGLGLPSMAPSSHAGAGHTIAGQHARPGPLGPPTISAASALDPRYTGYRPPAPSQAGWPLKSESSLLNHKEKERREVEDKERRDRREADERRLRDEAQRARESDMRMSREGFPSYIKEKVNGESDGLRDRSPIRLGSTPGSLPPNDGARTESPRVKPFDASSLVKKDSSSPRSDGVVGVDLSTSSRPSSSLSQQPLQPSDLSLKPTDVSRKESVIDSDISIIGETSGNRSGANSVTGRTSVNSDHSITRLNGLDSNSHSRDHGSPLVTNGLKSDSPASKHLAGLPGVSPGYHLYPPGGHRPPTGGPPSHQELLGRSAYPSLGHPSMDPRLAASQADSLRLAQLAQADPRLAQAAMVDPRMDPRMTAAMFPHMMAPSLGRAPGPFDYPGLDPFRDPYGLLAARDPLREARERELMRLNPLGSALELERAKALSLAAYPSMPGVPPGYPTTTSLSMMSGMASPYSSLYTSPSLPTLGLPLGHRVPGINGVPGPGSPYATKDPLRR